MIAPASCDELEGRTFGEAAILSTTSSNAAGDNPAFCLVSGRIGAALDFSVHLPEGWNGKALFLGGGGFDGTIPAPTTNGPFASPLQRRFVVIGTDSGHRGTAFDGSFALDQEALQNFADRAWHRVLLATREIVRAHYGSAPRRTYFEGGSSGGREGLIQAQRWPDDYDGVVARAPALSFTSLMLFDNRIAQKNYGVEGGYLDADAIAGFSAAVRATCDQLDGLVDGVVSNAAACHFDPSLILCTPPEEICLTAPQLDTVDAILSELRLPFALANGVDSHPGYPLSGAEHGAAGWTLWQAGFSATSRNSLSFTLQDQFVRYFVVRDSSFDSLTLSAAAEETRLRELSALLDATSADLTAFRARGGKLILWHGLADYAISAWQTRDYYERVVAAAGGQESADAFVRFYAAPGVDHTGGGPGAPISDLLGALDAWVEEGSAPGDLLAYRGLSAPLRPLCRYPTYPRYDGGDTAAASSFHCATPE